MILCLIFCKPWFVWACMQECHKQILTFLTATHNSIVIKFAQFCWHFSIRQVLGLQVTQQPSALVESRSAGILHYRFSMRDRRGCRLEVSWCTTTTVKTQAVTTEHITLQRSNLTRQATLYTLLATHFLNEDMRFMVARIV